MFTEETLEGKLILITGGGSGLGFAMAKGFVKAGAKVIICGRTEEKLEKACEKLNELSGKSSCSYYQADVRNYDVITSMFKQINEDHGIVNGLVNNAAGNFLSASEDLSPGGFKAIVDIVLHGSFNCTHVFGNQLIEEGQKGVVLNMVTTYAEGTGSAFVLPSACAKAGVMAMTRSLAYEWAHYNIRLNAIAPGPFPTEGAWSRLVPDKDLAEIFKNQNPMKRFGEKEELANLATFLMSDMAEYINGECITIDGGERLSAGQFNFIDKLMPRDKLKEVFRSLKPDSK